MDSDSDQEGPRGNDDDDDLMNSNNNNESMDDPLEIGAVVRQLLDDNLEMGTLLSITR